MFVWLVLFPFCYEISSGVCQTVQHAEKRVINSPGIDYTTYQQFVTGQPGLSAYSDFALKTTEPSQLSAQSGELPKNIRAIIVTKKVPVPYPVHVEKKVPFPVKVPIRRPYTVYVPKPYLVEVMKQVPYPVKVPFPQPYTVEKHVPVPYKVHYDKPFPVHISKPYPVFYEKRVPIHIEKPVPIPYKVAVDRPVPVHIPLEKPVLYPVERPYPFPVKVPVDKPVPSHVEKPLAVPVTVEKPYLATSEHSVTADYYSSTQPTVHHTFSPSPYDEMTSSLITQGKHKVMSFLPGSQNSLGSYGDHTDVGTIHVSNIKGNGGNSTDWVPKPYVPNSQYLTYIPTTQTQQKYFQYVIPDKTTKSNPVENAEPYVVKHNSVKMHYKLHYDPSKQEYSFQLVPRGQVTDFGGHTGYSFQSTKPETKSQPSEQTNTHSEYVYKPEQIGGTDTQIPSKTSDSGLTYSYQQVYQGKHDFNVIQPTPDSRSQTYSYQSPVQKEPSHYDHQNVPYSYQNIDSALVKPVIEGTSQIAAQPEVTYTYHQQVQASDAKQTYQEPHNDQHQVSYSYQAVDSDGKLGYDFHSQLKNSETYPNEQVSYMYIPQGSASSTFQEVRENPSSVPTYSISPDSSEINSEYQQVLYQQGRAASILREQYVTTQPTVPVSDKGRIPENFKSSRASEGLTLYNMEREANNSMTTSEQKGDPESSASNYFQVNNIQDYNDTKLEGVTSSITYQKFGVADVMNPSRTRLHPVNESAAFTKYEPADNNGNSEYSTSDRTRTTTTDIYSHGEDIPSQPTEYPFNTKVYRLPSYKVPKPRKVSKRKNKKDTIRSEDHTHVYDDEGEKTTMVAWYQVFSPDENGSHSHKDTNSHTGAAQRTSFYGYPTSIATTTTTTTTSSSLLPPDDGGTAKPTQSLRSRNRGSIRAYGRRKVDESATTEGYEASSTRGTRRRRRPARRRIDTWTDTPLIEVHA